MDTGVKIKMIGSGINPTVRIREWLEKHGNEEWMFKEYETEKGNLSQVIRKSFDYPNASIPLLDDLHVPPGRSVKYLIENEEDLECLECLFKLDEKEINMFYKYAAKAKEFCEENGIILTGDLDGVGDPLLWLSGMENILIAAMDNSEFMHRYVEIISKRALKYLEIFLNTGVDLILRRGWYESTDFWSPELYGKFLFNPLKKEIDMTHQAGAKYAYIMNSGATPLTDYFKELNIDILTNLEPMKNDIPHIKKEIGHQITLCGGVNNYHVIERGTEEEVEMAVKEAIRLYSPNGGFILAPGDSILADTELAQRNFYKMIAVWKETMH